MNAKKLAIIDLGTNTFHLLIATIDEREDFSIEEKFKEPVKLGQGGISQGEIVPEAFARGIKALKKFRKLIDSKKVDEVRAFATSAIRGASNREEFVAAAREKAGIHVKVINGNEEAALIYEGVRNGVMLPPAENTLIIDIGGGSVEFIVCREGKAQLLRSLPVGAARMLENLSPSDPVSEKDKANARKFLLSHMDGLLKELKEFDIRFLVGSSGSFETLGAMVANENGDYLSSQKLNSYRYAVQDFKKIHEKIIKSDRQKRLNIAGMDATRVDMIGMASLLIDLVLEELDIQNMMISLYAMKEGILYSYIQEEKERVTKYLGNASRDLRAKAIKNLCEKYNYVRPHALKVSQIAQSIFEQTNHLHAFGDNAQELLKYAALSHDIGYFINRSGHHKHGQYIIMHSHLSGFSHDEQVILGNIVRYHRKSLPTRDHFHYKVLEQRQRLMVRTLAGMLRIADNLDRGGRGYVDDVKVISDQDTLRIQVIAARAVDIEVQEAIGQKALLEQVFDKEVIIGQV